MNTEVQREKQRLFDIPSVLVALLITVPLWLVVYVLGLQVLATIQFRGPLFADAIYHRTLRDPTVFLSFALFSILFLVMFITLYLLVQRFIRTRSSGVQGFIIVIIGPVSFLIFIVGFFASLFLAELYTLWVHADVPIQTYRVAIIEEYGDIDFPDVYVYVLNKDDGLYKEYIGTSTGNCLDFAVERTKDQVLLRSQCPDNRDNPSQVSINQETLSMELIFGGETRTFQLSQLPFAETR